MHFLRDFQYFRVKFARRFTNRNSCARIFSIDPSEIRENHRQIKDVVIGQNSGLNQNIVYMIMVLQRLPEVEQVAIIDCSEAKTPHPLAECGILNGLDKAAAAPTPTKRRHVHGSH